MTLGEQQRIFVRLVGEFLTWVYENPGWELSFGECYRTPEQAELNAQKGIGISHSLHTQKLAIDLNLFIAGEFQTSKSAYAPLGAKWKSMHPLARWGGDFLNSKGEPKPDADHFSLEYGGVK